MNIKCKECPECSCAEYILQNDLGEGYRVCRDCHQEWYININYKKYQSPVYYEVFTSLGRSLPPKDRKGDANYFDIRSIKRRARKLTRHGLSVTVFKTKFGMNRKMVFSTWPVNAMDWAV